MICNKCILPDSYPGIYYDDSGNCNYCLEYKDLELFGENRLIDIINKKKNPKSGYDSIVALSGGRDSTYALWYYVKKLNLKVLAHTIDNGFIPEHTWKNISNTVRILGVDHIVTNHNHLKNSINPVLKAFLKKPSASMVSILCLGCRIGLVEGWWKTAKKYSIPLILAGGGEPEVSFATAFFTTSNNKIKKMLSLTFGFSKELLKNYFYLINPKVPFTMAKEYIYNYMPYPFIKKIIYPELEYYSLFRFIKWEEEEIMNVITKELKWEKYKYSEAAWRSDCKLNLLKNYFYFKLLGFSKNDELLSNLIRQGKISKEEAMQRSKKENEYPEEFFKEFFNDVRIPYDEFINSIK